MSRGQITKAQPRYRQVADALTARVRNGTWAVGAMLPTVQELCASFDVSRHTMREALRLMEEDGLVARRQGRGTTVLAERPAPRFVQDISSMEELLQYPEQTRLTVLRVREIAAQAETARLLNCAEGENWLQVEAIRRVRVTAAPLCFTTLLIRPEFLEALDQVGVQPGPVYSLIERRFGVRAATIEVDINAAIIPAAQADILQVESGAPALLIRRRYADGAGRVLEVSDSAHPAARFTYRATLRRT